MNACVLLQARATAEKDAETAEIALQGAQAAATTNESRALQAEQRLAEKAASYDEAEEKLRMLQVCISQYL